MHDLDLDHAVSYIYEGMLLLAAVNVALTSSKDFDICLAACVITYKR